MNERMKVLELLQDGKITAEQAAELLSALDDKDSSDKTKRDFPFGWTFPKKSTEEWKAMTTQIKSTVQQHLEDLKKNIDIDEWSFKSSPRIAATVEKTLATDVNHVTVETKNGKLHATRWDGDHVRLLIRSYVKADSADEARRALEATISLVDHAERYECAIQPTRETGEVTVELSLPSRLKHLRLVTQNGSVRVDGVQMDELTAETHNGNLVLYEVAAERARLSTHNGTIDLQHSITSNCRSVYARTHNGTIDVDGIAADTAISGTAKSHHGRIEIVGERLVAEYDHPQQRQHARFHTATEAGSTDHETQIFCETNNGSVIIRA